STSWWSRCHVVIAVTSYCCLFFFFQAEDGIRDATVTGVQTCALPISDRRIGVTRVRHRGRGQGGGELGAQRGPAGRQRRPGEWRSEERRVGKECRARWSRYDGGRAE